MHITKPYSNVLIILNNTHPRSVRISTDLNKKYLGSVEWLNDLIKNTQDQLDVMKLTVDLNKISCEAITTDLN